MNQSGRLMPYHRYHSMDWSVRIRKAADNGKELAKLLPSIIEQRKLEGQRARVPRMLIKVGESTVYDGLLHRIEDGSGDIVFFPQGKLSTPLERHTIRGEDFAATDAKNYIPIHSSALRIPQIDVGESYLVLD